MVHQQPFGSLISGCVCRPNVVGSLPGHAGHCNRGARLMVLSPVLQDHQSRAGCENAVQIRHRGRGACEGAHAEAVPATVSAGTSRGLQQHLSIRSRD